MVLRSALDCSGPQVSILTLISREIVFIIGGLISLARLW